MFLDRHTSAHSIHPSFASLLSLFRETSFSNSHSNEPILAIHKHAVNERQEEKEDGEEEKNRVNRL